MSLPPELEDPIPLPPRDEPVPEIDVVRARRETPGCANVLHFNNAGAALMPEPVLEATVSHLRLEGEIGGYEAAVRAEAPLNRAYESAAALIGATPGEIAFTESATRAWGGALLSLPLRAGDRILAGESEYASNYLAYLQAAKRIGVRIEVVPSDESGQLSVAALADTIGSDVKLISVVHVPTNSGLVNPVAAVGRIARDAGIPYLLDACQSVGQMPVDVAEIGCDFLAATGRKFLRAPRGTGFLYARREVAEKLEPIALDLASAEWVAPDRYVVRAGATQFEQFEGNIAGRVGLCAGFEYARQWGLDTIYARIRALAAGLRAGLGDIPRVTVRDIGAEQCGIVTFTMADVDAHDAAGDLRLRRINVAVSQAAQARLDMDARGLAEVVRASVHYYNTEDEVQRFLEAVEELAV